MFCLLTQAQVPTEGESESESEIVDTYSCHAKY